MGAVSDIVNMGDWSRMRMWLLAIGIAILGSAALHASGQIDLGKSIYRTPTFTWLSYMVGGADFRHRHGTRLRLRLENADPHRWPATEIGGRFLVLGLVAYMTMRGVLGVFPRQCAGKSGAHLPGRTGYSGLLSAAGMDPKTAFTLAVFAIGGGLTAFCLLKRDFWTLDNLLGGVGIGLTVVAAWYVSGHLGYLAEHPETLEEAFIATNSGRMESLTFVAPQAYTLELLMLWSDTSRKLSFGIATALGVIAGSAAWALLTRTFRWEGFAGLEDTANHLIGAALMGFGGVVAMGCTVGQGITGFSTLALGSIVTFLAIVGAAAATLKFQYWRLMREA
jgi:hypothetical protein